jgi:hypothetical protein
MKSGSISWRKCGEMAAISAKWQKNINKLVTGEGVAICGGNGVAIIQ